MPPQTPDRLLRLLTPRSAERVFLVAPGPRGRARRWSVASAWREAAAQARRLEREGLAPGGRLALGLPGTPEALFTALGALWLGASLALVPPGGNVAELPVDAWEGPGGTGLRSGAGQGAAGRIPGEAVLAWTSGTTGAGRGVLLTLDALLFTARASWARLPRRGRNLAVLRHGAALDRLALSTALGALAGGGRAAMAPPPLTGDLLRDLGVDVLRAAPSTFQRLRREVGGEGPGAARRLQDLMGGTVRWGISSGAPLAEDDASWWRRHGLPVWQRYGTTETGLVAAQGHGRARPGTVGPLVPGVEIRFGPRGEMEVRSPGTVGAFLGGGPAPEWVPTGDRGFLRDNGDLVVAGRLGDDLVTSRGRKIEPGPVEALLGSAPGLVGFLLLGTGRPRPLGLALLDPGAEPPGEEELRSRLAPLLVRLAPAERPAAVAALALPGERPDKAARRLLEVALAWLLDRLEGMSARPGPAVLLLEPEPAERARRCLLGSSGSNGFPVL